MNFYSQTDNAQPSSTGSTSGNVQPKYIKILPIHSFDKSKKEDDISEELTKDEEEKFYKKIMKTTLL